MALNTFAKAATSLGDEMLMLAGLSRQEVLGRPLTGGISRSEAADGPSS